MKREDSSAIVQEGIEVSPESDRYELRLRWDLRKQLDKPGRESRVVRVRAFADGLLSIGSARGGKVLEWYDGRTIVSENFAVVQLVNPGEELLEESIREAMADAVHIPDLRDDNLSFFGLDRQRFRRIF